MDSRIKKKHCKEIKGRLVKNGKRKNKSFPRKRKYKIQFNTAVLTAEKPVSEQILKFASDNKVNLIIVGNKRLNKISKIKALGSVSRKISENADCPVMIIH